MGKLDVCYFAYRDVLARHSLLRYLATHADQVCDTFGMMIYSLCFFPGRLPACPL